MPMLPASPPAVAGLKGLHLYHFGMSNCSQRVRLLLEEKQLAWTSHPVDLSRDEHAQPAFLAINPRGVVPVLVHDGRVITESLDILEHLEACFPSPSLRPDTQSGHAGAALITLAGEVQPALKLLSHEYLFKPLRRMRPAQLERFAASHADAALVQFMRDFSSKEGFGRARICAAAASMERAFGRLEAQLADGDWLAGPHFSSVDIAWMPNLRRMALMRFPLRHRPKLHGWARRVAARPSFRRAILDYEPWPLRLGLGFYAAVRGLGRTGLASCLDQPAAVPA